MITPPCLVSEVGESLLFDQQLSLSRGKSSIEAHDCSDLRPLMGIEG